MSSDAQLTIAVIFVASSQQLLEIHMFFFSEVTVWLDTYKVALSQVCGELHLASNANLKWISLMENLYIATWTSSDEVHTCYCRTFYLSVIVCNCVLAA